MIDPLTNRRSWNSEQQLFEYTEQFIHRWKRMGWERDIPPIILQTYRRIKSSIGRNAQNYRIQGASGSMTKIAGVLLRRWIIKHDLWDSVEIINMVHDEIVTHSKKRFTHQVAPTLKGCMEEAGSKFVKSVPMIANPMISSWWNH